MSEREMMVESLKMSLTVEQKQSLKSVIVSAEVQGEYLYFGPEDGSMFASDTQQTLDGLAAELCD